MSQQIEYKGKALIVAPFWGKPNHVGNYRIERFIRWLKKEHYSIIVIKAAFKNEIEEKEWGLEISVIDRIGKTSDFFIRTIPKVKTKIFSYIWYAFVIILCPVDPYFFWARKLPRSKILNCYIDNVDFIISSSPPYSGLIAAYKISKKHSIPEIADLRDGWLDEPLMAGLKKFGIRRTFEGKLEKQILLHSAKIFVTSNIWEKMLSDRLPEIKNKISVLTNAYPNLNFTSITSFNEKTNVNIELLYVGRFTGSSYLRRSDFLFHPLFSVLKGKKFKAELFMLSNLKRKDKKSIDYWISKFENIGCNLSIKPYVNREKMLKIIAHLDGLLLLSTGKAPIPSKTFEYIKSSKPILAITLKDSAVWQIGQELPQMFLFDYSAQKPDYTPVEEFLNACQTGIYEYKIPNEYSEEYLSKIFLDTIRNI